LNILFLTISTAISDISNRGIYPDLLRKFLKEGHHIYIVCPTERRYNRKTELKIQGNLTTLQVKTLNITKTNIVEKGIATILIEYQFARAINKYFLEKKFDLILYSTPPITFNNIIRAIKKKCEATSYLLLKDIFPQNAVDLGMLSKWNPLYWFFRKKEKGLYELSDWIGCMSPANVAYILKHNPAVSELKVEVCPNSIEPIQNDQFVDRILIRKKYKIPVETTVFMYGGNLGKPQGVDFLIEVLKSNLNRKDSYFVIAGDGTEYSRLNKYIDYEKAANISLMKALPKKDFDDLISACDVGLIFLDYRYTIPNYPSRLLTYMEFKMPVLMATDEHTDVGKIARENSFGHWVKSGLLSEFNRELNYFIEHPKNRIQMGQKGHDYLLKNYTVDTAYEIITSHFHPLHS
jgi:glycosyltransferase involved in cell wall biosynthesis